MSKQDNLKDFLKDVADTIREKKGTTELIAPVDFAEEIKGITAGGGESAGSSWRYFDVSELSNEEKESISYSVLMSKTIGDDGNTYIDSVYNNGFENAIAVAFDGNAKAYFGNEASKEELGEEPVTMNHLWELAIEEGHIPVGLREITEEEFYDVNVVIEPLIH